jgi:hypothetical protein
MISTQYRVPKSPDLPGFIAAFPGTGGKCFHWDVNYTATSNQLVLVPSQPWRVMCGQDGFESD